MKKKFSKLAGILICIAFAVFLLFLKDKADVIWEVVCVLASILTPFIYAFALAYILNFPYRFFKNKVFGKIKAKWFQKVNKPLSLVTIYLLFVGIMAFLVAILIPQLTDNINNLIDNLPGYLDTFTANLKGFILWINSTFGLQLEIRLTNLENITATIIKEASGFIAPDSIETVSNILFPFVYGTAMFFYNWIMAFIISIYMLSSKEILCSQVKRFATAFLPTIWMPKIYRIVDVTDNKCGKFLVGKILDSTIIGLLCFIAMTVLRIPYAPLISVIIGGTNVIPFFGPFIGAIPSAILLLFVSPIEAVKFVIMVFILQQLDGNFIGPKVVGSQVGLIGFWSLFSVIVAGGLFGVPGMVLGTPIFAAIYTLLGDKVSRRIKNKGECATEILNIPVINSSTLTNIRTRSKSKCLKNPTEDEENKNK